MNSNSTRSVFSRPSVIGAGVFATVAALTLAAGLAHADTPPTVLTTGHVDVVHVALNGEADQLVLGTNDEAGDTPGLSPAYYSQADVDSGNVVLKVTQLSSGVCVIPEAELAATGLWGGFAAAGTEAPDDDVFALDDIGYGPTDTVTIDFDKASGPGNVSIDFNSQSNVTPGTAQSNSGTIVFSNLEHDDEAYHHHPDWTFTADGTYEIEFQASTSIAGVAPSDVVTYTFDVDCGA